MKRRVAFRGRLSSPKPAEDRQDTQLQLLEAAGREFAEKGFDRATAKEICERAGANTAAVNYYFGGIEGLHAAVLEEARNRLFSPDAILAAVAGKSDPKAKLEAALDVVAQALTGPLSSSWVLRVLGREMVAPSPTMLETKEKVILPRARLLRQFIAELMKLPEDHPAVARGCISLMAPICMLIVADRRHVARALPALGLDPDDAPALARHMFRYALAGLEAVAREARKEL
ncbi:MAG TPA: CerR family C-terminal domain-containing protein [Bradyrhizobium sp.]|nr:CerR family C-terminal domain-containing protein [Bradyrhizobium sp.]